jgi:DUF4097 and DUF4098 domain-containing protein YvlB
VTSTIPLLLAIVTATPTDTTLRLPRDGSVAIEAVFASVTIEAGNDDRVIVQGAGARLSGNRLRVEAVRLPMTGNRGTAQHVRVTVPAWAPVRISAVSGDVETRGGTATLRIEAPNGKVTVREFRGTVLEIEAVNDNVVVTESTGTISIESVNGNVTLTGIASPNVRTETLNGNVQWSGPIDPGGRYLFWTHNGNVELNLPRSVQAQLRGTTTNGSFNSTLPGTAAGDTGERPGRTFKARKFSYTWGRGSGTIEVETFNGNIRVGPLDRN